MNITMLMSAPYPPREGIGFYCTSLAKELVRQHHRVTLITRGTSRTEVIDSPEGYRVIKGKYLPLFPFHVHIHGKFIEPLIKELESETDVFHLHSPLVPVIKTQKPVIMTMHSPMKFDTSRVDVRTLNSTLHRMLTPISIMLENRLLKSASKVTVVSNWVKDYLRSDYGLEKPAIVMGNGFDEALFQKSEVSRVKKPYVLFVGRLEAGKGILDLIQAFALLNRKYPDHQLKIVGGGTLTGLVQEKVRTLKLEDSIELLGVIGSSQRNELVRLYSEASMYVLPSYHEGLPTTLIEAMASGVPCITTHANGCSELIDGETNGYKVSIGDVQEIFRAMDYVLSHLDEARSRALVARDYVKQNYVWAEISKKYAQLYGDAI